MFLTKQPMFITLEIIFRSNQQGQVLHSSGHRWCQHRLVSSSQVQVKFKSSPKQAKSSLHQVKSSPTTQVKSSQASQLKSQASQLKSQAKSSLHQVKSSLTKSSPNLFKSSKVPSQFSVKSQPSQVQAPPSKCWELYFQAKCQIHRIQWYRIGINIWSCGKA